ncbi:MAG TPA: arginine--tRNA ligase [Microbacteriaceae bacterium]|nr:arginine--tRNA ligase [Microbacteriaceae bacterium]
MNPEDLAALVAAALHAAADARGTALEVAAADVPLERPKNPEHGDWASTAAMKFAKPLGVAPRELAAELVASLTAAPGIREAEIAGPGFINIRLDAASAGELARTIVAAGDGYGRGALYAGERINVEFVSANPTGPIHLGGTRWAAVGDSLARILAAQGAAVTREYYFNDHGAQIDRFARSLVAAHLGRPAPEDGYGGAYIGEIAARVAAAYPGELGALGEAELQEVFRSIGVDLMFAEIKASLHDFGVDFDVYFHENDLHASGAVERAVARLRELGHIFERDGATWLGTTAFGDDKDRVVIKSDGEAAYISGDLAYYLDKRERGFDRCIIMLGADHHGYVKRMMAMCAAFGDEPGVNLEILIGQLVNLVRTDPVTGEKAPVRMSKRAGTVVTLEDLVDAVGVDAARFALVRSTVDTNIDIDLDVLASRTNDNPVFYVQYAHARTAAVVRNADAAGVERTAFDASLLTHDTEARLLGALAEFPRVVAQAAQWREPHRVARYLEQLAALYHRWYDATRVAPIAGEPVTDLHRTRRWLNDATAQVLRNGLGLIGVGAPERM